MKIVSTFHSPTSVSHSIRCNLLRNSDLEFLVVAKTNKLDVFALLPDGLKLQCSQEIWGRITSLTAVPSTGNAYQSDVAITTDHPDPYLFIFEFRPKGEENEQSSEGELSTSFCLSLFERGSRPTEFFTGSLVDYEQSIMVLSSYVGKLKIIEIKDNRKHVDFDSSVRELNILSVCFLRATYGVPVLALLYKDHTGQLLLTSHDVSVTEFEVSSTYSPVLPEVIIRDATANLLIPVPTYAESSWNSNGAVIVLGGRKITLYTCETVDRKQKRRKSSTSNAGIHNDNRRRQAVIQIDWPYSAVSAWESVGEDGTRFLIGDAYGRMVLLAVSVQSKTIDLVLLGNTSPASCISLLSSEYIHVGSHFGDSQLVRLDANKSVESETFLEVVDRYKNISPIMDALIADIDGSGRSQIVTCSGGNGAGSIRVIQNGANFEVNAAFDGIPDISRIFCIKKEFNDRFHSFVLAATPMATHLYEVQLAASPTESATLSRWPDSAIPGILRTQATLAIANVAYRSVTAQNTSEYGNSSFVLQVVSNAIILLDMSTGVVVTKVSFEAYEEIVAADISPSQICVGLRGGKLLLFNLERDQIKRIKQEQLTSSSGKVFEISVVSIIRPDPSDYFAKYVAVGFWEPYELHICKLNSLDLVGDPVVLKGFPRSVISQNFGTHDDPRVQLLIGQGDGTLVTLSVMKKGVLGSRKIMHFGKCPLHLSSCLVHGRPAVFAAGEWSSVIYLDRDTVQHSSVPLKDVRAIAYFSTIASMDSTVFASGRGLSVGYIEELNKLHIRTVSLGFETPIRIAYDEDSRNFAVGCIKSEPCRVGEIEEISSSVKIIDRSFNLISTFSLDKKEELSSLNRVTLRYCDQEDNYFICGTYFYDEADSEPQKGRLLLFSARTQVQHMMDHEDSASLNYLLSSVETPGCVYAINNVDGRIVAAVNTSVIIYSLETSSIATNSSILSRLTEWNHNYLVTNLAVRDDLIITGDAISSLALLKFDGNQLQTLARDYGPLWPLSLEFFDSESVVGANSDSNLFSFRIQTVADKFVLERNGNYNVDDNVNKFISGPLLPTNDESSPLAARQVFFTASGRIGVVIDAEEQLSLHLSALQRNLENVFLGPGKLNHAIWRTPVSGSGRSDAQATSFGFLDGDFLEKFLDWPRTSDEIQKTLIGRSEPEKLEMSYEEIHAVLDTLQTLH